MDHQVILKLKLAVHMWVSNILAHSEKMCPFYWRLVINIRKRTLSEPNRAGAILLALEVGFKLPNGMNNLEEERSFHPAMTL